VELLGRKSSGFGLEKREYGHKDPSLTMWHPLPEKGGGGISYSFFKMHNFERRI
jgi:hypothetical protein